MERQTQPRASAPKLNMHRVCLKYGDDAGTAGREEHEGKQERPHWHQQGWVPGV